MCEKERAKTFKDYLVFWLFYDKALDCREIVGDLKADFISPVGNIYYINSENGICNYTITRVKLHELQWQFRDMKLKLLVD